jgi:hypothetical protein
MRFSIAFVGIQRLNSLDDLAFALFAKRVKPGGSKQYFQ